MSASNETFTTYRQYKAAQVPYKSILLALFLLVAGSVMLGRLDEAAAWRTRAVGSRADITAEWFCRRDGFGEGDRCEKLVRAMAMAGFQLCTSAEEAASWGAGQRLRECENQSQEQGSIGQVQ